jgi:hypothetical protein
MNEEINQLIRMAQVLRVRAGNLESAIIAKKLPTGAAADKARAVRDLALEAETRLKQIYAYFD